ncbi:MAG: hypothetical protein M3Q88_02965, partial [Pseudomonadota bacterium]|nr:hypothetical protein [Pseudomonadota bacterium]
SERRSRRRLINLGEGIAVAALVISALGLWNGWRGKEEAKPVPATIVERKAAVPLALRGRIEDDGKTLIISPVEPGHALDSLTVAIAKTSPIPVGSDGLVSASSLKSAVPPPEEDQRDGAVPVTVSARYIEAGQDRRGGGVYRLSYRWESGGVFGGRSLRLTGFSRA